MRDKKTWALAILTAALFFGAGWIVGGKTAGNKAAAEYGVFLDGSVRDALDSDMGWGRSASDLRDIEAVDVRLGVIRHNERVTPPSPAVALSIRNNGQQTLESFGVGCLWQDLSSKKSIYAFETASGDIAAGWTSQSQDFDILSDKWAAYAAAAKPDAKIAVEIRAKGKDTDKLLYRHVFTKKEIATLQDLR